MSPPTRKGAPIGSASASTGQSERSQDTATLRPQRPDVLATFEAAVAEDVHRTARRLTREGWPTGEAVDVVADHYHQLVDRAAISATAEMVSEVAS